MSSPTREVLMETAESLLRSRGYAAFSYADLAQVVGIRKASIHHHFPAKEDLGIAVVTAYVARIEKSLAHIEDATATTAERLRHFAHLFTGGLDEGFLPLCGALAAEMAVLPESLQHLTRNFLQLQCNWLQKILDEGVMRKEVAPVTDTQLSAHQILCQLEGASFVNWAMSKKQQFDPDVLLRLSGINSQSFTKQVNS